MLLYISLSFKFFTVTYVLNLQSKDGNFAEELKAPASGYLGYLWYTLAASWSREWRWQLLLIWPTTESLWLELWPEVLPQPERYCRSDELKSWLFWLNREALALQPLSNPFFVITTGSLGSKSRPQAHTASLVIFEDQGGHEPFPC